MEGIRQVTLEGLRSKYGVNVKLKVKKETEVGKETVMSRTTKKETGDNTAESTNEYHSKQLMEAHHTLAQKERTEDKNMYARRERRKKKTGVGHKRKLCDETIDQPPKKTMRTIRGNKGISVEIVDDADLEKWKELRSCSTLFEKHINEFNKITLTVRDVRTFTAVGDVPGEFVLQPMPGWTLALNVYGWGRQGGTMSLSMENKTMKDSKEKFSKLQYNFDFCNILKIEKGDAGEDYKHEWETVFITLKNSPGESEISYSTTKNGNDGMSAIPDGSIANYLATGKTYLEDDQDNTTPVSKKLSITLIQTKRCKKSIRSKVDHMITCVTEFSEHTRGMVDENVSVEKTRAHLPSKTENIYNWTDKEHQVNMSRIITWIDAFFRRARGGACGKYEMICTCRKLCHLDEFGLRLDEGGLLHYQCEQKMILKLKDYIT